MQSRSAYIQSMRTAERMTAEELLHLNAPNARTELVRGVLRVREPAGYRHGDVAGRLFLAIANHVESHALGRAFAAETGFTLARSPDTVRAPDVAFISTTRLPHPEPRGFAELAPDLAVEVLSPGDRPGEVLEKVGDWLTAGSRLVWIVNPEREVAHVHRSDGSVAIVQASGSLDGEDVVPGFGCSLAWVLRLPDAG
jgi:Uma2 family endonuclease